MTILYLDYIFDRMQTEKNPGGSAPVQQTSSSETMSIGAARRSSSSSSSNSGGKMGKRPGKRPGRKPSKIDEHAKLERSRQSARECRARKKLRYQYLEELVLNREKAVFALRDELETFRQMCSQMDQGGPVPEKLMKMIVTEEVMNQKRQMAQTSRALRQQQRYQQQPHQQQMQHFLSTSSSSSTSPPQVMSQWHQPQQERSQLTTTHQGNMSTGPQQVLTVSNAQNMSPNFKSNTDQRITPPLRRQMAIDLPQSSFASLRQRSEPSTSMQTLQDQHNAQSFSDTMQNSQFWSLNQIKQEPLLVSDASMSSNTGFYSAKQTVKQNSFDLPSSLPSPTRLRAFSNPIAMSSGARFLYNDPNTVNVTTENNMATAQSTSRQSVGFFSGNTLLNTSSLSNMSQPTTLGDNMSSGNQNRSLFFQSPSSPKRTLSDPMLQRSLMSAAQFTTTSLPVSSTATISRPALNQSMTASLVPTNPALTPSAFDPLDTLANITSIRCYSDTLTVNTPSPAPYSLIHSGLESGASRSPTPSPYQASATSSSTKPSSSGPLLSLNSFLEIAAAALPSAANEDIDENQPEDIAVPNFLFSQQTPTSQCTSAGLSASISEPIPEWYSFLADLHSSELALTSRHGASSSQTTPLALTTRSNDQPLTPQSSSSFMNVPNIINELLEEPKDT